MRTLIPQHPQHHFLFNFPTLRKPNFFHFEKCHLKPQKKNSTTSSSSSFNGWDDLMIRVDSNELSESNFIKKFLTLLGFNDKKYVFICMLGFVCALALSRVRVSSLVVFPASVIVFGIGFSFGFVNGRPDKGFAFRGSKRRVKDESFDVFVKKLRNLVDLFDGFDVKVSDLKNDIKKAIEFENVEVSDLEGYLDVVESIGVSVLNARNVVDDCIDNVLGDDQEMNKNLIQKKNKEIQNNGFGLFGFMGNFLSGNRVSSKLSKIDLAKRDTMTKDINNRARENFGDANRKTKLDDIDLKTERNLQSSEMNAEEATMSFRKFPSNQNLEYMNYRRFSSNMSTYKEIRRWDSDDSMKNNIEFELSRRHIESEVSYKHKKGFHKFNGAYSFMKDFQEERMDVEDKLHSRKYLSQQENDISSFSSSTVSNDVLFDKYVTNANDLLKKAKDCVENADNEMLAEEILYESAQLLSQAITMKPMSLLAIGQLGNTYLLHGEVKLRNSRELRRFLSRSDGLERQRKLFKSKDVTLPNREKTADLLVNVCEECETLLVEAGRKYRTALTIDGNDLRALYNWGLALSYRAQLIADIGPEAALDADKLFLAAIDKFDAIMSRSNVYAPEALYRWGAALQQRSQLRPSKSRDKVKLLQQAKTLYEDALVMGSDSLQVRKALSSCLSELDFYGL